MAELHLADLRRELTRRARAGPPYTVDDVASIVMAAYGLEMAEAIRDSLQGRIEQAHALRRPRRKPGELP